MASYNKYGWKQCCESYMENMTQKSGWETSIAWGEAKCYQGQVS